MFLRSCTSVYVLNSKAEQYLKSGFDFLSRRHPGTPDLIFLLVVIPEPRI